MTYTIIFWIGYEQFTVTTRNGRYANALCNRGYERCLVFSLQSS